MSGSIVCGVDNSRGARDAVRVAAKLSEQLGLRLVLLHVAPVTQPVPSVGIPHGYAAVGYGDEETQEAALRDAARLLDEVAQEYELEGRTECRLQIGDPVERLVEVADAQGAAMLVVGSRGRGALKSALLGSVSAGLVAKAPCPVVVVPPNVKVAHE